jgi:hypothetical protein
MNEVADDRDVHRKVEHDPSSAQQPGRQRGHRYSREQDGQSSAPEPDQYCPLSGGPPPE